MSGPRKPHAENAAPLGLSAETVLDAAADAVVVVNQRGRIIFANARVEDALGWPPSELVDQAVEILVPERLVEAHTVHRAGYNDAPAARPMGNGLELTARRRDGTEFTAEVSLAPLRSRRGRLVCATIVDTSARTALERQLRDAFEELQEHADEVERRGQEASHLAEMAELLELCQSLDEAYVVIAGAAERLFEGDAGALYALDPGRTRAEKVAAWGSPEPSRSEFTPEDCWGLRRGRLHVVGGRDGDPLCPHVEEELATAVLCEPLAAQADTLGLLHLHVRRRATGKARAAMLAARERVVRMLGDYVGLTLANIQLREHLREQSSRDQLTGLFNRRYMEETLRRELRRADREGYQVGLLMADLDRFKQLNDAFGHTAGDEELRRVGRLLATAVRTEDVACRFGGEEFVIILPKATLEDAHHRAEALRNGVKVAHDGEPTRLYRTTTMSVGVAEYPDHGASAEELIMAADSAMYQAKARGRDRVVISSGTRSLPIEVAGS